MIIELDRRYTLASNWIDVSYKQAADLQEYLNGLPMWLQKTIQGEDTESEDFDARKVFEVQAKCLAILSDCPYEKWSKVALMDLVAIYDVIQYIIVSMFGEVYISLTDREGFMHDGVYYSLPKSGKDIAGNEMPLSSITALEFCEASDLHQAGYRYAGNIVSVLCRRIGEPYNEEICKERGRWDLKMDLVYDVLSKLSQAHQYASSIYPNIYKSGKGKPSKINSFGWMGKILWLGGVENKEKIEQMPVYEFLRLLSFKLAENE